MSNKDSLELFLNKFKSVGEDKFYKFLISYGMNKIAENKKNNPAVELLDFHDNYVKLYRRENDSNCLELARIFRKASHKIYRIMIKKNLIEKNNKFLNVIK